MQTLINSPDIVHQAQLPLKQIVASITNPRKHFDDKMIADLAASIEKVGVLQPILVRLTDIPQKYEIVAGECRFLASVEAGLETIPAVIRDLTDLQALELQVLENLHRTDLHPLEEAEGFQQLIDSNGYSAATLANRIGKSKAYVYASLKLCALCDKAREAFYDAKLTASTALLIARIPGEKLQTQALKEITIPNVKGEIYSYREAARIIHNRYTLDLTEAIFNTDDGYLVEEAGDCTNCPKRSGNARELFADIESADVCTDTECFQQKRQAHIDQLMEDPHTIMGDAAKQIMPTPYWVSGASDYDSQDNECGYGNEGDSWKDVLGDELPTRIIIVEGRDPVAVVDVAAARELAQSKGLEAAVKEETTLTPYQIERRERDAAKAAEQKRRVALFTALHNRLADSAMLKKLLAMAIPLMISDFFERLSPDETALFFGARGEEDWLPEDSAERVGRISELFNKDQSRLLIELFAVSAGDGVLEPGYCWDSDESRALDVFNAILSAAGIDPKRSPETPTDPTSAAHAEEMIAREENPAAALAGETEPDPQGDHIQAPAIAAASQRAAETPAADVAEVLS